MKPELLHLIDCCKAAAPGEKLQTILIFANGAVNVVYNQTSLKFRTLDELERWAYPHEGTADGQPS